MRYEIDDDSGMLAIIDPDAYRSFIQADWTLTAGARCPGH
jgi:hypothetical protein